MIGIDLSARSCETKLGDLGLGDFGLTRTRWVSMCGIFFSASVLYMFLPKLALAIER